MYNKRRVAFLLAAAMIFTSLPFNENWIYASELSEDISICAEDTTCDDVLRVDGDLQADDIQVSDDLSEQDGSHLSDEISVCAAEEISLDDTQDETELYIEDEGITTPEKAVTDLFDGDEEIDVYDIYEYLSNDIYNDGVPTGPAVDVTTGPAVDVPTGAAVTVETPTSSVPSGKVIRGTKVMLECATPGADIYYAYDEKPSFNSYGDPVNETRLYTDPLPIKDRCTINAIARLDGFNDSEVATFSYTVDADWGDINRDVQDRLFNGEISEVPEDIWFLVTEYDATGLPDVYRMIFSGGDSGIRKPYTGKQVTIDENIEVFSGTKKLWAGTDYTLKYSNNTDVSVREYNWGPTATLTGKGNFSGKGHIYFAIDPAEMNNVEVTSGTIAIIGEGKKLGSIKPEVTYNGTKLVLNKDYECEYSDGATADTKAAAGKEYTVTLKSKSSNYTGLKRNAYVIMVLVKNDRNKTAMSNVKVTLPKQDWKPEGIKAKDLFDNSEGDAPASVKNGNFRLIYGTDFVVEDEGKVYTDAGTYEIILKGTGAPEGISYYGIKKVKLTINGIKASKLKVGGMATTVEYKGSAYELSNLNAPTKDGFEEVTVYNSNDKQNVLTRGRDYEVSFMNTGALGNMNVVFMLKGRYEGMISKKVTVKACNINNKNITVNITGAVYSKKGAIPRIEIRYYGKLLNEGVDYSLSYKNNEKLGMATVTVKGTGNFTGSRTERFEVARTSAKAIEVFATDLVYTNKAGNYVQVPKLMDGGKEIQKGKDGVTVPGKKDWKYYDTATGNELDPKAKVDPGTCIKVSAEVTIGTNSPYYDGAGDEDKKVTVSGYYRVIDKKNDISKAKVKVENTDWLIFDNGKELLPNKADFKVVMNSGEELEDKDFDIVSVSNSRFMGGSATVVIRGKGNYGGLYTIKVKVKPRMF